MKYEPRYLDSQGSFNAPCERVMYNKDLRAAMQRMLDWDVIVPYAEHVIPLIQANRTVVDVIWQA